ncbi:autotransporter domain-containing protein [Endozoicomonas lisbonensis]
MAVTLGTGDDPYKLTVDSSSVITIDGSWSASKGDAMITINAKSAGIRIKQGGSIDNQSSPPAEAIYVSNSGTLAGTLTNEGAIQDGVFISGRLAGTLTNEGAIQGGVFISGRSTHQTGKAYYSQGNTGNWASLRGSYTVLNGGVTEAMNDHAVFLDDHSYIDSIEVGSGSTLKTTGDGTAAVYVNQNAEIGGSRSGKSESDSVFTIEGTLSSSRGQAINIAGSATGKLHVSSTGTLSGKGGGMPDGAALLVTGTYTGNYENKGDIKGGIFISGTHNPTSGMAYEALGTVNDPATLSGGYATFAGGVSRSNDDHAVYLNDHSMTDFVVATGENPAGGKSAIEAMASGKSAIYVANGAQLGGLAGRTEKDAAIIAKDGGTIKAMGDSDSGVITVKGDLIGKVYVDNGFITASSPGNVSLDFTTSNKPMLFEQVGNNSKTTGTILASAQHQSDWVAFRGGSFEGETIQNVDHLVVSTITKGVAMSGNFTLPAQITVELVKQEKLDERGNVVEENGIPVYEFNGNALMTVSGRLDALGTGSNIQFKPASTTEYNLVKSGVTLTVVDPNSIDGAVAGRVTVDSGSFLVEATEIYSDINGDKKLQVQLKSRDANDVKQLVMKSGTSPRASEVFSKAVDVISADTYADATKGNKVFARLNATDYDVKQLAGQIQPRVSGEVQKASQAVANTAHNIVFNRIHGLRRGISYGDQFSDGALWGQMLYNSGKQDDVDGEPGFESQTWGITLGADAELEPAIRTGLAVSLVRSTVDGNETSNNKNYGYLATWYNSWNGRGYFLDTMLSMGSSANDMTKVVDGYRVKADFTVDQWGARVIGGNSWRIGSWTISPQAEFNYGLIRAQDYEEKGDSGFEQKIQSKDYNTWELGGGMKFNGDFWFRSSVIKPELAFMGYYDFGTDGMIVKSTYLAGGDSFIVTGPDRDKLRLHMGLGLGLQLTNSWAFHTGYNVNWKKNYRSHSFSAKARYEF